jgi:hypothetical protein
MHTQRALTDLIRGHSPSVAADRILASEWLAQRQAEMYEQGVKNGQVQALAPIYAIFDRLGYLEGQEPGWMQEARAVLGDPAAIAAHNATLAAKTLRDYADTRGVNIGDEDSDWWQGYRQAQRECFHDARKRADDLDVS